MEISNLENELDTLLWVLGAPKQKMMAARINAVEEWLMRTEDSMVLIDELNALKNLRNSVLHSWVMVDSSDGELGVRAMGGGPDSMWLSIDDLNSEWVHARALSCIIGRFGMKLLFRDNPVAIAYAGFDPEGSFLDLLSARSRLFEESSSWSLPWQVRFAEHLFPAVGPRGT
jgi:hypothetical protein